ncbi:YjbH domain-containing protein [Roseomonas sp. SSH11]|uniref:YjbH domain-containing protein n=1 Tax=Pararoseomonas baculiformis TaxID=2820812 RepID=A0ABS4A9D7_9PROT|nr:YjbH domain-containing protein [Pararoseomonas baculiformis]MBP0443486.1 YjbH domain-containing protein [Pararoseomonas baculiformis]
MKRAAWLALLLLLASPGHAEEVPATGGDFGGIGLLETRNARFREDGTLEAGGTWRRQRRFWFVNFQPLPFLETTFRLTERLNATAGRGSTTDRALDLKLRLLEEGRWTPALAIGLQDVIGTGIHAGEYLVASRRWGPLDVSLGLGFGRLGTRGDFANPLTHLSDAFRTRPREVGSGGTLRADFFRGEEVAVFGGAEYAVPSMDTPWGALDGLRARIEWSGDALRDERGGYPARRGPLLGRARSPVNLGLQWSGEHIDASIGFVHGTDLLARLSLRMDPANPPSAPPLRPLPPMPARRGGGDPDERARAAFAALRGAGLRPLAYEERGAEARIAVADGGFRGLPQLSSRVMRAVNGILPPEVEAIRLSWWQAGAEMGALMVPRRALEAVATPWGSVEEAWGATTLFPARGPLPPDAFTEPGPHAEWLLEPRLNLQLGDPSRTLRYQGAVALGGRVDFGEGFSAAGAVQQALFGNLERGLPSDSVLPRVRSDYAAYARDGKTSIPGLYGERVWNLAPDVFARATAGLLEPMFGGVSSELLWRPVDRGFALGLDLNLVQQRATDGLFGFRGYGVATGHVSLYAELPVWNLYGILRAGRYLAGDWGGTVEIGRRFDSGIEVGGFATFTNVPFARFGEGSFDKGIYLRVPLNLFGADSRGHGTALIRPVQRDGGQRLAVDNPLWEVTRAGREDAVRRAIGGYAR